MSKLRILIPALIVFAAVPAVSNAQVSVPFVKTTYHVQVQYEFWRSGGTYWSTVFSTEDEATAELMFELLDLALENGQICGIINCNPDYLIRDVRLEVQHEYPYLLPYDRQPYYRSPATLTTRR